MFPSSYLIYLGKCMHALIEMCLVDVKVCHCYLTIPGRAYVDCPFEQKTIMNLKQPLFSHVHEILTFNCKCALFIILVKF